MCIQILIAFLAIILVVILLDVVDRIFELLDKSGMEQKEFAIRIGADKYAVSKWRNRKSTSYRKYMPQIANVLNSNVQWILTGTGEEHPVASVPSHNHRGVKIPVLGNVAAGVPIEAVEEILDYEEIEPELAATGEFFGLRLEGQSMEPRMCEGDVVIVRCQNDVETGDIAVVLVNGNTATVKRIKKESDGSIWLLPNNPTYSPTHYSPGEIESLPICIIGKVVEFRGKL